MLIDAFREVAGLTVTDEDGNRDVLRLLPPATAEEVAALEKSLPAPLPADIRETLAFTKGLANGPIERLTLIDDDPGGFGLEDVFPHAHDGRVSVLATIACSGGDFIAEVRARDDVTIIEVTAANRNALPASLLRRLGF